MRHLYSSFLLIILLTYSSSFKNAVGSDTQEFTSAQTQKSHQPSQGLEPKRLYEEYEEADQPTKRRKTELNPPRNQETKQQFIEKTVFTVPNPLKFSQARRHFHQGLKEHNAGNYQNAFNLYKQALNFYQMTQTPSTFDNTLKYRLYYHAAKALDQLYGCENNQIYPFVIEKLKAICDARDAPDFLKVKAYFYLSSILNNLGFYKKEIEYYQKALALTKDPEVSTNILYHCALTHKNLGQTDQAFKMFDKIYRSHQTPQLVRLYVGYELGLLQDSLDRFEEAIRYFDNAITYIVRFNIQDEIEFDILYYRALIHSEQDQHVLAHQDLNKIITDPRASGFAKANAHYQLGLIEARQHHHKNAIKHYDCVLTFFNQFSSEDQLKVHILRELNFSRNILRQSTQTLKSLTS